VLVAIVVGGAWGAARLAPTRSPWAAAAAAAAYGWSPFVHERLLLGHWALLVGWAVLPWAARASLDWRAGAPPWRAFAALAVAALGGAEPLLLVAFVVVVCGRPLRAFAATVLFGLPWLVPSLMQPQASGDPRGVAAFSANSDTSLGVVGSLLTGGGVWAREAVPPGRSEGSWIALSLLVVAALGLPLLRRRMGERLLVVGVLGLVIALLAHLPGGSPLLRWAIVHLPASGLLRDGQRWIAPIVLLTSVALACGVEGLLDRVGQAGPRLAIAITIVLAPVAALPGAAWGEGERLQVSQYPADWRTVPQEARGSVLVLPWSAYRAFPWDHETVVLDPAVKLLGDPVWDDGLPLTNGGVLGEDPVAAKLTPIVKAGTPLVAVLQGQGIDQVLVERTTEGFDPVLAGRQTHGLTLVRRTPELELWDVPGSDHRGPHGNPAWPVVLGDIVALLAGLGAVVGVRCSGGRGRRRTSRRSSTT
jgi:hypothetical protein